MKVYSPAYQWQQYRPLVIALLRHNQLAQYEGLSLFSALGGAIRAELGLKRLRLNQRLDSSNVHSSCTVPYQLFLAPAAVLEIETLVDGIVASAPFPVHPLSLGKKKRLDSKTLPQTESIAEKRPQKTETFSEIAKKLALLRAGSKDTLALAQLATNAMVGRANDTARRTALTSLKSFLGLTHTPSRLCLLRRLTHDCPFANFTGLLLDVVKDCVQCAALGKEWDSLPAPSMLPPCRRSSEKLPLKHFKEAETTILLPAMLPVDNSRINPYPAFAIISSRGNKAKSASLEKQSKPDLFFAGSADDTIGKDEQAEREKRRVQGGAGDNVDEHYNDDLDALQVRLAYTDFDRPNSHSSVPACTPNPFWSSLVVSWFVANVVTGLSSSWTIGQASAPD